MVHNLLSIDIYNTVGLRRISFFSEIRSLWSVTPFFSKRPLPPPKKMPPRRSPYRLVSSKKNIFNFAIFILVDASLFVIGRWWGVQYIPLKDPAWKKHVSAEKK
jgi:hypothetical protein